MEKIILLKVIIRFLENYYLKDARFNVDENWEYDLPAGGGSKLLMKKREPNKNVNKSRI